MAPPKITLYYDSVSPYSLLAFEVLQRYKPIWKYELELMPFFLGGVMQATNNRPPATVPAKGTYMVHDITRNAKLFGIPNLNHPPEFPAMSLKAQRALTAIRLYHPDKLVEASRSLWKCYWSEGRSLNNDLAAYLSPVVGADATETLLTKTINEPAVKDELTRVTKEAIEVHGAFGAPWIVVENGGMKETFFGSDRFEAVAMVMGKEWYGPVPKVGAKL
ncbi:hypothetical protein HK104_005845 [Borealophlyctis nickersoniae]|nr:hypothetical protein HK104_005845 [Borealophlyctis nickersoniae]